jgi:type IX secretion system PorP/SprF family membrane protein
MKLKVMKKINLIIAFFVLMITSLQVNAQQDPQFTQYFDNALFVNPAYAGSTGMLSAMSIHREQWVGFEGRPSSTTLSLHSPLSYESVGLGLTAVRDVIGPLSQTMFYGDFSYSLKLTQKSKLAFGLKAGLNLINSETSTLSTTQAGDQNLQNNFRNRINPNFGFGMYYHSPRFFAGLSTPKLIEQSIDGTETNKEKRHYFAIIGAVIPVSKDWKIRPTSQVKATFGAPMSIDLSVAGIYSDKLWLGSMYRLNAAYGVFAQYQINPQFRIGIATDFSSTLIRKYNYGTFEVMLSYDFRYNKQGIRSPRYF